MSSFMDNLADEAADLSAIPDDQSLASLSQHGRQLVQTDSKISELEQKLEELKSERKELVHKTLPDILLRLNMDNLGMAEENVDLVMEDYAHASISKDWDDVRRQKAFDHLESLGAGDLVKSIVTLSAGKGDLDPMRAVMAVAEIAMQSDKTNLVENIESWLDENWDEKAEALRPVSASVLLDLTVPWNTLTSFVKEQLKKGTEELDLEVLGATSGKVVKIKKRK